MKVFVAGATGVLGKKLVPRLIERGHKVTAMTRDRSRTGGLETIGAEPVVCDVYDADGVDKAVWEASPEIVVHQLTALPKAIDPRKIVEQLEENDRIRVEGTRNLLHAARNAGVRRIVAQSVAFAYAPEGGPVKQEEDRLWTDAPHAYRRTVDAIVSLEQQTLEAPDIEGVVLRYGYFYGPGSAYAEDGSIAEQVRSRRFPIAGGGGGIFSFIHVDDAAAATVAAVEGDFVGVCNVCDDLPVPLHEWLPVYARSLDAPVPPRVPGWVARLVAGRYAHYMMTEQRGASNDRAKRELDWSPRFPTLQAGLS